MHQRPVFLEFLHVVFFLFHLIESYSQHFFSLTLKVQECVWSLEVIKIILDIVVIVDVFFNLLFPLEHLHLVKHQLRVEVVEENPHFCLLLVVEVEPELLHFERLVLHVVAEVDKSDSELEGLTEDLGINALYDHLVTV